MEMISLIIIVVVIWTSKWLLLYNYINIHRVSPTHKQLKHGPWTERCFVFDVKYTNIFIFWGL